MKLNDITTSIKGFISSTSWKIEKHAPEILLAVGIASTIGAVVAAVKATPKASAIIEDHQKQMEIIHKCDEVGKTGEGEEYTHDDCKKDTVGVYMRTGLKFVKLYGPTALLVGGSIVSQVCGYKVLSKRLAAASAAYAALATKFKDYRKRVADKFGINEERSIYHDMKAVDVQRNGEDENGNPIEGNVETVFVADDDDYTALFTQYDKNGVLNLAWEPDSEQNLTWLSMRQNYWNQVLKCRKGKPVMLNEIREDLGVGRTQKGQAVGWVYKPDDPKHVGDNFIDFGLDPIIRAYRNGDEMPDDSSFMLDFNVDGNVVWAL